MLRNIGRVGAVIAVALLAACSGEVAAPVATAAALQATVNTGNFVRLDGGSSKDPQGRPLFFQWSFLSVPGGSAATLVDADKMLPSFLADMPGDYVVQLVVSNGVVQSAPVTVTVHVTQCGFSPPTVTAAPSAFPAASPAVAVPLSATATDPDNACLIGSKQTIAFTWSVVSKPAASNAVITNPAAASTSFTPDVSGQYQLEVVATDSTGRPSTPDFVNITVTPCDKIAPSVALAGAVNGSVFTALTLPAAAITDTNCLSTATHSLHWTLVAAPAGSASFLDNPAAARPSFTPDKVGEYQVSVVATNSLGIQSAPAFTTATVSTCALTVGAAAIAGVAAPPGDAFPRGSTGSFAVFAGDRVSVAAPATSTCPAGSPNQVAFKWTLLERPAGSTASLSSDSLAQPSFVADVSGGTYKLQATVTDSVGNTGSSSVVTVTASSCGSNPIVADVQDLSGTMPFDDHVLTAVPAAGSLFSADDDNTNCPTRFAGQYSFTWSSTSSAPDKGFVFDSTHGQSVHFTPGGNAVFNVKLVVSGGGRSAEVLKQIAVSCSDVIPKTGAVAVASSTPGFAPGKIFRDDTATLSANPTSLCFSAGSTAYSYLWSLTAPSLSAAHLSSIVAATPTFSVDLPSSTYAASVIVVDKLGNRSEPTTFSVTSESCGINPVIVTVPAPTQDAGTRPFDPWSALPFATSDDDDATKCPQRFHQTYPITKWEVSARPAAATKFSLSPVSGATTTFREGEAAAGTFTLKATAIASSSHLVGTNTQDVHTASCATPGPTFTRPVFPIGVSATPPTPDPFYAAHPEAFFNGDTVDLTAPTTFSCYTSQAEAASTYAWSTTAPPPITFAPSAASATPSFLANAPNRTWHLRVDVQDHWGNTGFTARDINSGVCSAAPITAQVDQFQVPGDLPMDTHRLTANPVSPSSFFSDDSNPAVCPGRFAPVYIFAWSLPLVGGLPQGAQLASTTTQTTMLTPQTHATFFVHLVVSGNGQSFSPTPDTSVDANCAAPTVTQPSFVDTHVPARTDPAVYKGDLVSLATIATSHCFAHPTLQYTWSLLRNGGADNTSLLPDAFSVSPTFVAADFNDEYGFSVQVADGSGQTGLSAQNGFIVSGCGSAPPALTVTNATQKFTEIRQSDDGAAAISAPLVIELPSDRVEPAVSHGSPAAFFNVPFYLNTPITVPVQFTSTSGGSCPSFGFTGATLVTVDNNNVETPVDPSLFTAPAAGPVTPGSTLTFTFNPQVGDTVLSPVQYRIKLSTTFGDVGTATVAARDIHVGGRCGLNKPLADALFDPAANPVPTNTIVMADAVAGSTDPDNAVLTFFSATNTSADCGFHQAFTFQWTLTPPDGSTAALTPDTVSGQVSFLTDASGTYDLGLAVTDDTATPAGPQTGTNTFHITVP